MSKILMNASPAHLFDRVLAIREGSEPLDWYEETAKAEYNALYHDVRDLIGGELPPDLHSLTRAHRDFIGESIKGGWPESLAGQAAAFSHAVGLQSAERWRRNLSSARDREQMLWRLLRLHSSPYFVLGATQSQTLRLRIGTPWDWRQVFRLRSFTVSARGERPALRRLDRGRRIPGIWRLRRSTGTRGNPLEPRQICGTPEAKIYLDSPHESVPGYFTLS